MWLYLPPALTSAPSQGSAPLTTPLSGYFHRLARSCTWRTSRRTFSDWRRVWRKERALQRLCGPTLARSPSSCSEDVRTWLSAVSPARISPLPGSEAASEAGEAVCSSPSSAPFATYDRATSSWRTLQRSLWDETWTPFQGRWPKSGLMLDGAAYERPTLARLMAETAGGASRGTGDNWPTASASQAIQGQNDPDGKRGQTLTGAARGQAWPTPNTVDSRDGRNKTAGRSNPNSKHHDGTTLSDAIRLWPTPNAMASNNGETPETWRARPAVLATKGYNGNGAGVPLAIAAQETLASLWATPQVGGGNTGRGGDRADELLLRGQARAVAENWATPSARDWRSGDASPETLAKNSRPLNEQATAYLSGPQDRPTETDGQPSSPDTQNSRPQLNPVFVEWLMGIRLGSTCVCAIGGTD